MPKKINKISTTFLHKLKANAKIRPRSRVHVLLICWVHNYNISHSLLLIKAAAVCFPPTSSRRLSDAASLPRFCLFLLIAPPSVTVRHQNSLWSLLFTETRLSRPGSAACGRLPRLQNAELSAPTAEILVNSKTKPHSLGRDSLCPLFFTLS